LGPKSFVLGLGTQSLALTLALILEGLGLGLVTSVLGLGLGSQVLINITDCRGSNLNTDNYKRSYRERLSVASNITISIFFAGVPPMMTLMPIFRIQLY